MEQRLRSLIKEAMQAKAKEKTMETECRYQTLKNILESAQKSAKEKCIDTLTDSMIIDAAKKEIKQLNDLLSYCENNEKKRNEISICKRTAEELLPKMASEEEIKAFVETNKSEANNIGAMMKLLKAKFGDSLDGKMASEIAKTILTTQ